MDCIPVADGLYGFLGESSFSEKAIIFCSRSAKFNTNCGRQKLEVAYCLQNGGRVLIPLDKTRACEIMNWTKTLLYTLHQRASVYIIAV